MEIPTCVHKNTMYNVPGAECGKPSFTRKAHGFLCIGHYKYQQESIPAAPRKPQPRWKGLQTQSDDGIIADIIATDRKAIRAGKVVEIKCGVLEPIILTVLVKPTVH